MGARPHLAMPGSCAEQGRPTAGSAASAPAGPAGGPAFPFRPAITARAAAKPGRTAEELHAEAARRQEKLVRAGWGGKHRFGADGTGTILPDRHHPAATMLCMPWEQRKPACSPSRPPPTSAGPAPAGGGAGGPGPLHLCPRHHARRRQPAQHQVCQRRQGAHQPAGGLAAAWTSLRGGRMGSGRCCSLLRLRTLRPCSGRWPVPLLGCYQHAWLCPTSAGPGCLHAGSAGEAGGAGGGRYCGHQGARGAALCRRQEAL